MKRGLTPSSHAVRQRPEPVHVSAQRAPALCGSPAPRRMRGRRSRPRADRCGRRRRARRSDTPRRSGHTPSSGRGCRAPARRGPATNGRFSSCSSACPRVYPGASYHWHGTRVSDIAARPCAGGCAPWPTSAGSSKVRRADRARARRGDRPAPRLGISRTRARARGRPRPIIPATKAIRRRPASEGPELHDPRAPGRAHQPAHRRARAADRWHIRPVRDAAGATSSAPRLEALPEAVTCRDCQARSERVA